ncbi:MAG: S24/S26 family peptidase [Actinobacteria bacterium]|nr:S24/S26 family peptidase [Actinomycetota bacterium]MCG2807619.1 S24/S26 family peptidase [Coriobacteriia bacterium]
MSRYLDGLLWLLLGTLAALLAVGVRPAVVAGRSMEPALVPGDVCLATPWARPRVGDIILFSSDAGRPVLHRAVAVGARGEIRTRGDANHRADSALVIASSVRGRVVAVLPLGRALRGWMRSARDATLLSSSRYKKAMTERRSHDSSADQGEVPFDCKDLRGRCERFTLSAAI